ncbi:hypothetical protein H6F42_04360 [Pseudanabaena sp. FACHB-1998]|uniref:hypothetical protein n=1 Tax=Pseudanabaena sp. FACHB-1998 TaxID=2692858 RepID=UPI0016818E45|nr:hypothetical protein [Pseudanabaena sp. FACHB-1998]MBD2176151.1 hypothetical protein [Pseudanabaena sp. FACHB-1998]
MTIKEQLIREIEQTPEALLIQFMQVWRSIKKTSKVNQSPTTISEFFRQSPLAELAATGELDLSRDKSLSPDRWSSLNSSYS